MLGGKDSIKILGIFQKSTIYFYWFLKLHY